jgi:uncharacterized protein YlxW (UPF0749 family)
VSHSDECRDGQEAQRTAKRALRDADAVNDLLVELRSSVREDVADLRSDIKYLRDALDDLRGDISAVRQQVRDIS